MKRARLSQPARRDLNAIVAGIADEVSASLALKTLSELRAAVRLLGRRPDIGHFRPDLTDKRVRFWLVRRYLIVYREGDPVEVVRILHGARDVKSILKG